MIIFAAASVLFYQNSELGGLQIFPTGAAQSGAEFVTFGGVECAYENAVGADNVQVAGHLLTTSTETITLQGSILRNANSGERLLGMQAAFESVILSPLFEQNKLDSFARKMGILAPPEGMDSETNWQFLAEWECRNSILA